MLASDDSYVVQNIQALDFLRSKHPDTPSDRRPVPQITAPPLQCCFDQVLTALHSFRPGSSSNPDGLRPQHVQDMFQAAGPTLSPVLVDFANMVLSSGVPREVRHIFFGANLHALKKNDGGFCPVAVGMTLRRLVSKIANRWGSARMSLILAPRQLGMGTRRGVEAGIHAARAFLDSATASLALLISPTQSTLCVAIHSWRRWRKISQS